MIRAGHTNKGQGSEEGGAKRDKTGNPLACNPRAGSKVSRRAQRPDLRGSVKDRRPRRQWLLDTFGNGSEAPCHFCGLSLDIDSLTVDRVVPGSQGGTYGRGNIRPACGDCNHKDGIEITRGQRLTPTKPKG